MEETHPEHTGISTPIAIVRTFIRAVQQGDTAAAAVVCQSDALFLVECGCEMPVVTYGPRTFVALSTPQSGMAYRLPWLKLHAAPGGVVAVWRAITCGELCERRFLGVSVFRLQGERITGMETTYVPVGYARSADM